MKPKYAVGQKVRIRKNLEYGKNYSGHIVNSSMAELLGKKVKISKVTSYNLSDVGEVNVYNIKEDRGCWSWTEDMFEPIKESIKQPPQKLSINSDISMEILIQEVIINDPAVILFYRPSIIKDGNLEWGDVKKVVAKCNTSSGDVFDEQKGIQVAVLKAYRKEIDNKLRKF